MGRDDDSEAAIASIVEAGRRTRRVPPRWLWIAALIVGAVAATGFVIAMTTPDEPAPARSPSGAGPGSPERSGLGSGLLIGAAIGVVIGFAIARQRRDHSSRNSP